MSHRAFVGALLAVASLAFSCGEGGSSERLRGADHIDWVERNGWSSCVAADLGEKLGGCVVGDVDPSKAGDEIVVVGESGAIYLISFEDGEWQKEVIANTPGEMVQVVLGDVDPARVGLEIVVVGIAQGREDDGGEGAAHVLFLDEGEWIIKEFHRSPALLHAAWVAELDGTLGAEVFVGGYAEKAVIMDLTDDGWVEIDAGDLPGPAKNATKYRNGVAVACADGSLAYVHPEGDGFAVDVVYVAPAGNSRVASDGLERLLVAQDDGVLSIYRDGKRTEIHRESDKLRGAVLGNLDFSAPAIEAITGGYGRIITMLNETAEGWVSKVIYEDSDRLHHLAAGRLATLDDGLFLVACGFSGRVIVLRASSAG
jgi:hypothetical protein